MNRKDAFLLLLTFRNRQRVRFPDLSPIEVLAVSELVRSGVVGYDESTDEFFVPEENLRRAYDLLSPEILSAYRWAEVYRYGEKVYIHRAMCFLSTYIYLNERRRDEHWYLSSLLYADFFDGDLPRKESLLNLDWRFYYTDSGPFVVFPDWKEVWKRFSNGNKEQNCPLRYRAEASRILGMFGDLSGAEFRTLVYRKLGVDNLSRVYDGLPLRLIID